MKTANYLCENNFGQPQCHQQRLVRVQDVYNVCLFRDISLQVRFMLTRSVALAVVKAIQTAMQQIAQRQNHFSSSSPVLKINQPEAKILYKTKDP
ncbi:hypothetical protein AVEN_146604-1 [Araneus ventricosus]|uniref:Uncharacterized protein n=1 Tax=Araneus ventricosus TaxID=182803 RepID=A0A4Y2KZ25_ARAVE|nr:hypothetical protein AVEN_146604-1 [Araneus ventricosus]